MRKNNVGTKSSKTAATKTTTTTKNSNWTTFTKNICNTPYGTYRVRVCGDSCVCKTKKAAFAKRKEFYLKHGKA